MLYCKTVFQQIDQNHVEVILSAFTRENFVRGQAAYELEGGGFNIDAGENDVRAFNYENECSIKFVCRDEGDMRFYDKKLSLFASNHGIQTKNSTIK
ncbi:hypothetical protein KUL152_10090 [Tenacibaculum sp. KUL152]|nr:hypothetical protein KUL152_10090 [Tenacibaculum sp. KUL152]